MILTHGWPYTFAEMPPTIEALRGEDVGTRVSDWTAGKYRKSVWVGLTDSPAGLLAPLLAKHAGWSGGEALENFTDGHLLTPVML